MATQYVEHGACERGDDVNESDINISQALQAYQKEFSERLRTASEPAAESAREIIAKAVKLVRDSGIGEALAPRLLEHVMRWPSWSKRDGFEQRKGFPADNVRGSEDPLYKCVVHFTYKGAAYILKFSEDRLISWGELDNKYYGKVQLFAAERMVIGLNTVKDLNHQEGAQWEWCDVFAFVPGTWMKDLLEIAAYIKRSDEARLRRYFDDKDKMQAAGIEL